MVSKVTMVIFFVLFGLSELGVGFPYLHLLLGIDALVCAVAIAVGA